MTDSKKINVIKIPNNEFSNDADRFERGNSLPRIPRQYLELLENKEKIKPELVNRDYDPSDAESVISAPSASISGPPIRSKPAIPHIIEENDDDDDSVASSKSGSISISDDEETYDEDEKGTLENDSEEDKSEGSSVSEMEDENASEKNSNFSLSQKSHSDLQSEKNETRDKIRQMLQNDHQNIPKLADLERDGMVRPNRTIPYLDYMDESIDDDEEDQKRELLFKFELLKKSYKNAEIPDFTIHSSLKKMSEAYENQLRHLSLDSSVENYKNFLIAGFMVFEFVFGVWLKFDMSGFSQQQILNMSQYERLLIELGQKSYVPESQQWPVEFRLVGLITLNAVIFIISKMILKRTGSNLMGMMNHVKQPVATSPEEPKKKMKPPSFDFNEL